MTPETDIVSAVPADIRTTSPWRVALPAVLVLMAGILLLYRDTAAAMVDIWSRSDTFAHAFLVPPISLWLIWRQRDRLAVLAPRPQPWVLLLLLGAALAWLLADIVVVNAAAQFALVAMLVLAVPAVLGLHVAGAILFPLMFLFFAVPFGEFMLPPMMEWTADFVVLGLQFTGIPVYREGMQFVIPSGNWSVIDECSGVRYLIASFMVGTLFAYLNYRSTRRRIVFMAVSILVPIVANWLRAYIIVMLGHLSGNRIAVGVDHLLYGWVFFGVVIMVMFLAGSRWSEPDEAPLDADSVQRSRAGSVALPASATFTAVAACTAIVLLPHAALWVLQRTERAAAPVRLELPAALAGGWAATDTPASTWRPAFGRPSADASRIYAGPAGSVGVHLAYFRGQSPERKLVSSQNVLVAMGDKQWNLTSEGQRIVSAGGQAHTLRTAEILGRPDSGLAHRPQVSVWRVYWVDGRFIAGDAAAKLAGGLARLRGRGDEGAALLLYADAQTPAESEAALEAFASANLALLGQLLQQTRDSR